MYNIEQLRMFVEAVEQGSFSASARKLGKVQSAVSQGINNLEIDLNIQLFDRSTRKPTLTREGRQLFKQVKAIVLQVEELNASVESIENGDEELIRLAVDDALMVPNLPKILLQFAESFPATEIELISTASMDVVESLTSRQADIGIMFTDLDFSQDIHPCFIGHLPFKAICHPAHPLAELDTVTITDAIKYRQLLPRGNQGAILQQFPVLASKVWWSNSFSSIKHTILHGNLGWSYLPAHMVDPAIESGALVELRVSIDHKTWSPPVDVATLKSSGKGPALQWLEEHLKQLLD
ncbi:LysR family transcriptional regulator [Vibrio coralliilyticus]|uniref:LysR family transcriptional regulator n=1 Tax=Vibrio coralliilyticus TaxID=190893 RepID=UPI0002F9BAEB|nr:LysR family transcriptional regulator [Vibrio coralliilyticus]